LILTEANISFDITRISDKDWFLNGEMLLSLEEFERLTEIIRTDVVEPENEDERIYRVPDWLKNEFTKQELDMFRNQFMIIDVDKGGAIDAYELQELTESLGNRLNYDEALNLIADFDLDRSGTIDFGEFLTLMFKIKAGAIDAADNKLVTAILESKNQIKIFSEIEEIKHKPPKYIGVVGYGGVPVLCDFVIQGPKGSAYENGYFGFRVTFEHGYPYKAPTVLFTSRIIAVNIMQLVDGTGLLMHFSRMWDSKWNIRRLLNHVVDILISPDLSLIPPNIMHIFNLWLKEKGHEEIHLDPSPLLVSEKDRPPTPPPDVAEALAEMQRLREEAAKKENKETEKLPNLISMDELKNNVQEAQEVLDKANKAMEKANKSGKKKKINAAKKVLDAAKTAKDDADFALREGEEEEKNAAEAKQAEEDAELIKKGKSKMHANTTYQEFLDRAPRVEQMHLNVLSIFVLDKARYHKAIKQMTELFCLKNPIAHLGCLIDYDHNDDIPIDKKASGLLDEDSSLLNTIDADTMSELDNPSTLLEVNTEDQVSSLPHPWEKMLNEANDEFYYNPVTGEATWERPSTGS